MSGEFWDRLTLALFCFVAAVVIPVSLHSPEIALWLGLPLVAIGLLVLPKSWSQ